MDGCTDNNYYGIYNVIVLHAVDYIYNIIYTPLLSIALICICSMYIDTDSILSAIYT